MRLATVTLDGLAKEFSSDAPVVPKSTPFDVYASISRSGSGSADLSTAQIALIILIGVVVFGGAR